MSLFPSEMDFKNGCPPALPCLECLGNFANAHNCILLFPFDFSGSLRVWTCASLWQRNSTTRTNGIMFPNENYEMNVKTNWVTCLLYLANFTHASKQIPRYRLDFSILYQDLVFSGTVTLRGSNPNKARQASGSRRTSAKARPGTMERRPHSFWKGILDGL